MIKRGRQTKLDNYLDKVCAEVRARGMHREIREELSGHFEDLMIERQEQGASEEEAQQYAITHLGDPQTIGRELHRIHKPRIPWGLLGAVILLSAVSLLGMGSVEAGGMRERLHLALLQRQTVFIIMGISLMTGMYFINFKLLHRASGMIYAGALMLVVGTLLFGPELINGNRRYVAFMGLSFDLIGYSPYVFVVALAGIWTRRSFPLNWDVRNRALADFLALLLPAAIYAAIGAFPELVVYMAASLVLYIWITRRWITGTLTAIIVLSFGSVYIWNHMNLRDRIIGAVNHNYMLSGPGYLNLMIHESITSAGWRGHGFGDTVERLPYAYSDLFPVYLIQCFGWAGGLLFLAVVVWFVLKMFSYARAVRDIYGRMLILALTLMLSIRLAYGLSILTGRVVITAIPFPFLSYGQHVFIEFAAVGLLMGIYRRKDMLPAAEPA